MSVWNLRENVELLFMSGLATGAKSWRSGAMTQSYHQSYHHEKIAPVRSSCVRFCSLSLGECSSRSSISGRFICLLLTQWLVYLLHFFGFRTAVSNLKNNFAVRVRNCIQVQWPGQWVIFSRCGKYKYKYIYNLLKGHHQEDAAIMDILRHR